MERPNFKLGVDQALVLKAGSPDQAVVKGLNKLGLPDLTRDVVSAQEFRRDFDIEFTTTGKLGRLTYSGNYVMGDTKGQDQLKQYLKKNEKFTDGRAYIDYDHFMAPDLANDPASSWQISKHATGEADKNGIIPFSGEIVCGGLPCMFIKHLSGDGIAFVATGNKITDADAGFATAGFAAGQTLIVEGSANNDGQYLIKAVAVGELTLDSAVKVVADEAAGPEVTLHGGTL
ncbi:MAG: hypothetical protein AB7V08_14405 [Elusimicrobiales bacterium]